MIPGFRADGTLPPGEHEATWPEIVRAFGSTPYRRQLLAGLRRVLQHLRAAGCRRTWIDGSFVTTKPVPSDFDGCWDPRGVDDRLLDPALFEPYPRLGQKARYYGERGLP